MNLTLIGNFKYLSNNIEEEINKQLLNIGSFVFTFYTMLTRVESIHVVGM